MKPNLLLTLAVAAATAVTFSTHTFAQEAAPSPEGAATAAPEAGAKDGKRNRMRPDRQGRGDRMRGAGGLGRVGSQLDLSDEQRTTIQDLLKEARPELQPLLEKVGDQRKALAIAAEATPVDEAAIRAQASGLATLEADLAIEKAKIFSKIKATLTPQQVERLSTLEGASEQLLRGALSRMGNRDGRGPGMHLRGPRAPKGDKANKADTAPQTPESDGDEAP